MPRQCIISLDTVRESRLGRELCDAVGALDSELADEEATEIATWIFMVTGRCDTHTHAHTHAHTHMHARTLTCTCTYTNMHMHMRWRRRRDPQHAYHAYLASLPAVPDDVACWPAAHRGGGLEATPVAGEVQQAVDLAECPCLLEAPPWWSQEPQFRLACPASLGGWRWALGCSAHSGGEPEPLSAPHGGAAAPSIAHAKAQDRNNILYVPTPRYCTGLAARLPERLLPPGGGVSAADVLWARGVFLSRGFPDALLANGAAPHNQNSSLGGLVGCLLPVLDLANHQAGADVSWSGSAAGVALRNHTAIEAGAEVHNNYGDKDNESLLLHYGFCQRDNPHDAVRVAVSMPAFSAEAPPQREVFLVRRREEGGVPAELLEALARVARVISAAEAAHDAGGDAAAVAAAAAAAMAMLEGKEEGKEAGEEAGEAEEAGEGEGEGEDAFEDVEVGAQEVTSLIEILQGRLEPLRKTGKADRKLLRQPGGVVKIDKVTGVPPVGTKAAEAAGSEDVSSRRREYLAMYREGLRGVLQEAVESLQEMLLGAMAESEGEDEDEQ